MPRQFPVDSASLAVQQLYDADWVDLLERAGGVPSNPPADIGRLYTRDNAGATDLYLLDPAGVEHLLTPAAGPAPVGAQYVVVALDGVLSAERRLQVHASMSLADGGANGDITINPAFAAPALVLGTAAAVGVANSFIRSDATLVAFDVTAPTISAVGDAAATGAAAVAARRDHLHGRESFAVPAIVLGTAAAAGAAATLIRSDATVVAFDVTAPADIAAAAVVGVATVAPRRDHVHAHPDLASDLHTVYLLATGARNLTGNLRVTGVATEITPNVDTQGNLGTAALRWGLIRGVTITSGDLVFENGWRLTEAERLGLEGGVALVSPSGRVVASWKE